ncbi:MAG TPA: pyridoxamine 5'-phosphate oxidase [Steroidobacteraceae bacterium]|nr:pyridoxamine 5'-phosphate oxidase [Steroidobacteraceae bacterium]
MSVPTELLTDPLPAEPLQVAQAWLAQAWSERLQPNPNAMTLATATPQGAPSARIVLCKDIVPQPGYIVFYTNYRSRKGRELASNGHAAAVLLFDHQHRQVRIEGQIGPAPERDSDAYFASRSLASRIGAWASKQSEPIDTRARLLAAVAEVERRFGIDPQRAEQSTAPVPRPPHWGGYRLWAQSVELWVEGTARIHDRARWTRALRAGADGSFEPGPWSVTRLQP